MSADDEWFEKFSSWDEVLEAAKNWPELWHGPDGEGQSLYVARVEGRRLLLSDPPGTREPVASFEVTEAQMGELWKEKPAEPQPAFSPGDVIVFPIDVSAERDGRRK